MSTFISHPSLGTNEASVVAVYWEDCTVLNEGWEPIDELEWPEPTDLVVSVGLCIQRDARGITLAADFNPFHSHVGFAHWIPASQIKRVIYLDDIRI